MNVDFGVLRHRLLELLFIGVICFLAAAGCTKRVERVRVGRIQSVSASSSDPRFPPQLMLDGGSKAESAWHSARHPSFPQWIEIEYPEPVILDRLEIQSQYDTKDGKTNNLLRAPRHIEIFGGKKDSGTYKKITGWECSYEKAGRWCFVKVPASGKYKFYRAVIMDNYGDPDFVTVQGIRVFSHE